jgi:hypothetical protein
MPNVQSNTDAFSHQMDSHYLLMAHLAKKIKQKSPIQIPTK